MNLLDLMVKIGVDDQASSNIAGIAKGLEGKLATAAKTGAAAVTAVTGAVTAFSGAVAAATNAVANHGDEIDKTSQKLGVSAEAYQKWDYAMNISGTSMQNMGMGLKTLTNKLDDAKSGSAEAQEKFAQLGISAEQLQGMSREEAFEAAIKGFQGMADSTERAALANDIFGRSGQELTPLFNMTAEETEKLMDNAERLGMVMSDEAVKASAAFKDAQTTMSKTMDGIKNKLVAEFLPGITTVMDGLTEVIGGDTEKGMQLIDEGVDEFVAKLDETLPKAMEIGGRIMGAVAEAIVKNLPKIAQSFLEGITTMVESLADNTDSVVETAGEFFMGIAEAIAVVTPRLVTALLKLVFNLLQSIVMHIPDMLKAGAQLFGMLGEALAREGSRVLSDVGRMMGDILVKIGGFFNDMVTAGYNLVTGLVNGILSAPERVWNAITGIVGNAIDGAKKMLGIASPSKVFQGIGENTVSGLVRGIESGENGVENAMGKIERAMTLDASIGLPSSLPNPANLIQPTGQQRDLTVILELDKMQFARAVYRLNESETQRVGVKLAGGVA